MSEREIHIQTHTNDDGIVHLKLPVGIVNQDIDLTVSYSISTQEDLELAEIIANAKPASDLADYRGTLELTEDPVAFQQRIRHEW